MDVKEFYISANREDKEVVYLLRGPKVILETFIYRSIFEHGYEVKEITREEFLDFEYDFESEVASGIFDAIYRVKGTPPEIFTSLN